MNSLTIISAYKVEKNDMLKRWDQPVWSNLLFQWLCGTESQRQCPRDQLLKPKATNSPAHSEGLLCSMDNMDWTRALWKIRACSLDRPFAMSSTREHTRARIALYTWPEEATVGKRPNNFPTLIGIQTSPRSKKPTSYQAVTVVVVVSAIFSVVSGTTSLTTILNTVGAITKPWGTPML